MNIQELYEAEHLNGWAGQKVAKQEFDMLKGSSTFLPFVLTDLPKANRKMFLYELTRKVLKGGDTENYPQQVGDCTSFMGKNVGEHLDCSEIALGGELEVFKPMFPPYVYACSRVLVGQGRLGNSDGGVGSWVAESLVKYGEIAKDENDCPSYSGNLARSWGYKGSPQKFVDLGKQNIIKSAALIKDWDSSVTSVCNGFPVGICSNIGFMMAPDSNGFHRPAGVWNHAMTLIAVDDTYKDPFGIILNSWGLTAMGDLYDFNSQVKLPGGCLRVRASVINDMLSQGDSFAYSNFQGFPEQYPLLEKSLFKMV